MEEGGGEKKGGKCETRFFTRDMVNAYVNSLSPNPADEMPGLANGL